MKIILHDERPISWNKMYAGMHWAVRRDEAERVHDLVSWMLNDIGFKQFTERVDICITAYFGKRPLDPDNISSKLYVDGLVSGGLIENDTRQFVRKVTVQSEIDRENPRVEIEITEVEEGGII